jgi:L-histidine Nalpha-methyltransferase
MSVAASPAPFSVVPSQRDLNAGSVGYPVEEHVAAAVASAVLDGLSNRPRRLPAWLFYDAAGSQLFEEITGLPEYYLTRTERAIFAANGHDIIASAASNARLRIAELGAGSAEKTRLLLAAAIARQKSVVYEPVDVSSSALDGARACIEREIPGVSVVPRVMDYTHGDGRRFHFEPTIANERRLVLYIGSSIGNFEPADALRLLCRVRAALRPGDSFLLGVDLVKGENTLLDAYDDAAGVTAAFNRNLLVRLNRELDANFDLDAFTHCVMWNPTNSCIEMHLVSRIPQQVSIGALDLTVDFACGESIHTENSYKYRPGQAEALLSQAGFTPAATWTDPRGWFAVCLARVSCPRIDAPEPLPGETF